MNWAGRRPLTAYAPRRAPRVALSLGTLERCQRPRSVSPGDMLLVLGTRPALGSRHEGTVHSRLERSTYTLGTYIQGPGTSAARNTCNVIAVRVAGPRQHCGTVELNSKYFGVIRPCYDRDRVACTQVMLQIGSINLSIILKRVVPKSGNELRPRGRAFPGRERRVTSYMYDLK